MLLALQNQDQSIFGIRLETSSDYLVRTAHALNRTVWVDRSHALMTELASCYKGALGHSASTASTTWALRRAFPDTSGIYEAKVTGTQLQILCDSFDAAEEIRHGALTKAHLTIWPVAPGAPSPLDELDMPVCIQCLAVGHREKLCPVPTTEWSCLGCGAAGHCASFDDGVFRCPLSDTRLRARCCKCKGTHFAGTHACPFLRVIQTPGPLGPSEEDKFANTAEALDAWGVPPFEADTCLLRTDALPIPEVPQRKQRPASSSPGLAPSLDPMAKLAPDGCSRCKCGRHEPQDCPYKMERPESIPCRMCGSKTHPRLTDVPAYVACPNWKPGTPFFCHVCEVFGHAAASVGCPAPRNQRKRCSTSATPPQKTRRQDSRPPP